MQVLKTALGLPSSGKPPRETRDGKAAALGDVDGHEAAWAGVAQGVGPLDVADRVRAGSGARVQHGLSLLDRERAHPYAYGRLCSHSVFVFEGSIARSRD